MPPGESVGLCTSSGLGTSSGETFTEHYKVFYGAAEANWVDAKLKCSDLDMDLLMIPSEAVRDELRDVLAQNG